MRLAVVLYTLGVLAGSAAGALWHPSAGLGVLAAGLIWAAYDLVDVEG